IHGRGGNVYYDASLAANKWLGNKTYTLNGGGYLAPNLHLQPSVKANGSHDPLTISSTSPVSITISLDPGTAAGQKADWWVAAGTSSGWYSYSYSGGWLPGINLYTQAVLSSSAQTVEVLNMALPVGDYTFYFGVDLTPNGSLDMDTLRYDSVQVYVTK
ncbi:MAG: hypothetical protein HQK60_19010, partial [Deltaproteobacteria bacterium]|nr:hypothetical protein [Deltaproteobacteria bacterium]